MISFALPGMTWLTEVRCPPAVPLSYRAAEFAFEFDKIFTMILFRATRHGSHRATTRTNQLILLELRIIRHFSHKCSTLFCTSKVGTPTFEAGIVGIDIHRVLHLSSIVRIFRVLKSFVLVSILMFQAHQWHFLDLHVELIYWRHHFGKIALSGELRPLFADWAQAPLEEDPRRSPLDFDLFGHAMVMHDMSTTDLNTRRLNQPFSIANGAIIIAGLTFEPSLFPIVTFFKHAGQVVFFSLYSLTWMSARKHFCAGIFHFFDAFFIDAYILIGLYLVIRLVYYGVTVTAGCGRLLFISSLTIKPFVVRLRLTHPTLLRFTLGTIESILRIVLQGVHT